MDQQTKHNNKDGMNGDSMEGTSSQPCQDVATPGGGGEEGRDSSTPPTPTQSEPGEGATSSSSSASSAGGSREGSSAPSKASTPALPHVHYTRDELYELKDCPLSLEWPSALDPAHNKGPGRWDPERWMRSIHDDRRPGSGGQQQPPAASNNRIDRPPDLELKRSRDPRERVKQEEQDGLILSPQRRSFSTGCHGLQQPASTNRPDSPAERAPQTHREIPTRRIGSGRISRRMEDLEPPTAGDRREIGGRRDRDLERNLDRNLDRNIERGTIERNIDRGLDQQRDARDWRSKNDARFDRDDRYDNRRRFFEDEEEKRNKRREESRMTDRSRKYSAREEEAPEWFTEGPTSQNEFIELVGFDDIPEEGSNANKPSKRERRRSKRDKDGGSRKSSRSSTPVLIDGGQNKQEMDVAQMGEQQQQQQEDEQPQRQLSQPTVIEPVNDQPQRGFNIDDFLGDIIGFPGGAEEIVGPSVESSSSSKLRQFFQRGESPTFSQNFVASLQNSRRSSIDLPPHLNNMLSGLDSSRFFAPISPADKTGGASIVDLLQQAGGNLAGSENNTMGPPPMRQPPQIPRSQPPSIKALMLDGKGQSLEEVEAGLQRNMRRGIGQHNHQQPPPPQIQYPQNNHQQNKSHSAFNDFLSQVSTQGPGSGVASHPQGHNNRHNKENVLMKLLNGGMKDNHMVKPSPMQVQPAIPNAPTENDLIAMLMKGNNVPAPQQQGQVPPRSMPPPAIPNLNVPPPNLIPPHSQPPPPVHNMGPQMGNQGGPPQHREDIVLKLLQAQQQMQQQQNQQQQQQQKRQLLQQALQQGGGQAPSAGHLDPIQQLMGGIGRMSVSPSPQPQDRDTFVRDAIQRPDVQNLLQQVASGQVTAGQLYSQLGSGALNKSQSDAVTTVLRFLKRGRDNITPMVGRDTRPMSSLSPTPQAVVAGGLSLGGGPSISPRVVSPNPDSANMLNPHMLQQHQSRISPLMFAGGSGISVGPNGPRRTPSHQELVAHTQSIMQKALLKQELEKAKEKHRKREAECAKSPNPSMPPGQGSGIPKGPQDGSPNKTGVKSQSPLAFTPTSVMRKMTADKDRHDRSDKPDSPVTDGLKEIDRVRDGTQQNQQPHLQQQQQQHQQQQQQQDFLLGLSRGGKSEKRDVRSGSSPLPGHMMIGNRPTGPGIINFNNPNQRPQQPSMPQNIGNIRTQQQNLNNLRALHVAQQQAMLTQQLMRNGGMNGSNPAAGGPGAAPGNLGGAPHHRIPNANPPGPLHQLLLNNNSQASMHHHSKPDGLRVSLMGLGSGSHRSSPVNNLAQFFGRDILSQAGGLPELPGGKVLSLEEVERLQQQAVPN